MKNRFAKIINIMSKKTIENQKGPRALPVVATLYNTKTGEYFSENNVRVTKSWGKYIVPRNEVHLYHAERIVINKLLEVVHSETFNPDDWIMVITIRPCKHCVEYIHEQGITKVYFMYGNDKKDKHKIKYYKENGYSKIVNPFPRKYVINGDYQSELNKKYNIVIKPIRGYLSR